MYILGLNAYHPDSSAAIIADGRLIACTEEERFLRIKHWAGFPIESIRYCLKEAGIKLEDIDYITLNRNPTANLHKKIFFTILNRPSFFLIRNRLFNASKVLKVQNILSSEFSVPRNTIKAKIRHIEHHRSHLASAFFVSPFEVSTIVSLDGFGDFTSLTVAKGEANKIKVLYQVNFPHSLGIFYTAFTQLLGFKKFGDEYKMMGLAAYGKANYTKKIEEVLALKPGGRFKLNLDYFSFYKQRKSMLWDNAGPELEDVFSNRLVEVFGAVRKAEEEIAAYHCDLAASAQKSYEESFFHILNHAYSITGISNLCLAGGCALNSLANGKIFARTPFKEIYIQPGASDSGGSLGSAYYLYHQVLRNKRAFIMKDAYWGPGFDDIQVDKILNAYKEALQENSCIITKLEDKDELCRRTARLISEGRIVGWFQGRMEWGPRALGNRSILVDPRRIEMKNILNARIKKREAFRPFAPAVLLEKVGEYFEKDYPDPFMLKVYPVKEDKRSVIPAVTHIDGTGRLQTVSKEDSPLFWMLIKEFERITGIPVLLNTSFNENEPIVCKPQEALDCFLRTRMDILVLGSYLVEKGKL